MEETDRIQKYLCESIDENAVLYRWNPKEKLSLYLAGSYQFYMTELLGEKFLLVRPYEQKTVQNIKKQMNLIHEKTAMEVALILESPTNYRIKKLLQERVPFVSINKQLYLPFLALHIQKQKRTREVKVSEKFTPATQLIYLALLYSDKKEFGLAEIVNKLDISSMTAVRGMNELVCRNLVNWHIAGQTGRKKYFL